MKLNKGKCELIAIRGKADIKFGDGTKVPIKPEAKYLGCRLNEKGNVAKEINQRISECYITWRKLEEFWKHADCQLREKLIVYDAIIRSKLMYGLESAHLTETLKEKLDVFQRKGLRQIMKLPTTFGQMEANKPRSNTNDKIILLVNAKINTWEDRKTDREEEGFQEPDF